MGLSLSSLSFSALYGWAFGGGEYKVVVVGLDNAGKTTILYRMCVQRLCLRVIARSLCLRSLP